MRPIRMRSKVLCVLALGGGILTFPAFAQAALSAGQISAIQTSLTAALRGVANKGSEVIEGVIANSALDNISAYGTGTVSDVTSAVVASSEKVGIDECVIGRGIGKAAGTLARQNNVTDAVSAVASLTNQGTALERRCLKVALDELGYPQLAGLSNSTPVVVGGTGSGPTNQDGFNGNNPGNNPTSCLNPSCTSL